VSRARNLVPILAIPFLVAGTCQSVPVADPTTWAGVRVANLSPDLPAIDFCFAAQGGGALIGPQMGVRGEAGGLQYADPARQVGRQALIAAGTWQVRIIAAGAVDCASPIFPDGLISVAEGMSYTVAVTGLATSTSAPHSVYTWADAIVTPANQVLLRFVNAAMASPTAGSPPLDAGTGAPDAFHAVFRDVLFPGPASPSTSIDANGYATLPPSDLVVGMTVSSCLAGSPPGPSTCPISQAWAGPPVTAYYAATMFAVGGTATAPWRILTCIDNAPFPETVPGPLPNFSWCL
jgi:Domain of unknown function (DUF4397)